MTNGVFILLMIAALGHSIWNAISKQIPERDGFFTLILIVAVILYLPIAIFTLLKYSVPAGAWIWICISIGFEVLYFVFLSKAYQQETFLTVYPVARGSAPIFAAILNFLLTGNFIGIIGLSGIILTSIGILLLNQKSFSIIEIKKSLTNAGAQWALLTGICTASYSVADSMGVANMSAVLFKYIVFLGMCLGKLVYDRWCISKISYICLLRKYPIKSLIGGFLVFGVNVLVVYSMQSTPVAFVSATREMSIVFASLISFIWLKEKIGITKYVSIFLIFVGVILIKIG
jgi:drug/metabolite transporter (DMT)-like permease